MTKLESEELVKLAIEQAIEGLQVIDFDFKYLYLNEAACRHGQRRADDLIGRTMMECYPGIEGTPMFSLIQKVMETKTPERLENEFHYPDKSKRWFELSIEPCQLGVLVRSLDTTDRKLLQEQLWHSQKMEAVGRLAGGVAHDYNNKLAIILAYCEMAMAQSPSQTVSGYINRILEAVEQSATLTKQLLAFSRKQVLDLRNVNLNDVLTKTKTSLQKLIGEDVKIEFGLAPDLKSTRLDPLQTDQIILNLCINARDAMPTGGYLQIETKNVELDESYARLHPDVRPGHYVRLTVTDSGMGMSREVQQKIFEPFFTTKTQEKGTGLGLATVHGIVKQSNGHIWVYSEPGIGTVFKLYFPVIEGPASPLPKKAASDLSFHGTETVLIVEDDRLLREAYALAMKGAGYDVHAAAGPDEALALFENVKEKISLLVTDLILPKMNGRKLSEALLVQTPAMKVIYMSGYTENSIVHQGILDTESVLMQKPISLKTLLETVRRVLNGQLTKGIV